ncbi:MAG TPA: hypothetical protein VFZ24_13465 [Longimicrobiales bacterium]
MMRGFRFACARCSLPRAGRPSPARAGTATLLLVMQLTGCFTYVPMSSTAVPEGSRVSVAVTDRGRVALAEPVGPGVRRIEGDMMGTTDSSVVLSVSSVEYMDLNVPARWAGERLEISRDHIGELRERQLSRSRTWLAIGLGALAAVGVAFLAIEGFGGDGISDRPGNGGGGSTQ